MNQFHIMLLWGILMIGIGTSMLFTLGSFDCNTLPKGYWDQECQKFNLTNMILPLLPIGLGVGITISAFKLFRDKKPNYTEVAEQ